MSFVWAGYSSSFCCLCKIKSAGVSVLHFIRDSNSRRQLSVTIIELNPTHVLLLQNDNLIPFGINANRVEKTGTNI